MKAQLVTAFAVSALILGGAVTVHAYTYTCEEGKFQIDVPEGWEVVTDEPTTLCIEDGKVYHSTDYNCQRVVLNGGRKVLKMTIDSYIDNNAYKNMKTQYNELTNGSKARYYSKAELAVLNVDAGWIHEKYLDAYFIKGKRVYTICLMTVLYDTERDVVIKMLNSFRALD